MIIYRPYRGNLDDAFDKKNGWQDSGNVCTKRMGDKVYDVPQCIGTCATKYVLQDRVRRDHND